MNQWGNPPPRTRFSVSLPWTWWLWHNDTTPFECDCDLKIRSRSQQKSNCRCTPQSTCCGTCTVQVWTLYLEKHRNRRGLKKGSNRPFLICVWLKVTISLSLNQWAQWGQIPTLKMPITLQRIMISTSNKWHFLSFSKVFVVNMKNCSIWHFEIFAVVPSIGPQACGSVTGFSVWLCSVLS